MYCRVKLFGQNFIQKSNRQVSDLSEKLYRSMRNIKIYMFLFVSILFVTSSCKETSNKATKPPEVVSLGWDENVSSFTFATSEISLPYLGNISAYHLRLDTLKKGDVENLDKFFTEKDYVNYIAFPPKGDVNILLIPTKPKDFRYGYTLVTVKGRRAVSDIFVEGEWTDPKNERNNEIVSFTMSEFFVVKLLKVKNHNNLRTFEYKKYEINDAGALVEVQEKKDEKPNPCFAKEYSITYPLTSADLQNLDFVSMDCTNIEGIEDYACYDGIRYITLKNGGGNTYCILVNSECGDFVFTDILVIKNNRVSSGLTVDSSWYEPDAEEDYSEETSFEMSADFSIKLQEQKIADGRVLSSASRVYTISSDGQIIKK